MLKQGITLALISNEMAHAIKFSFEDFEKEMNFGFGSGSNHLSGFGDMTTIFDGFRAEAESLLDTTEKEFKTDKSKIVPGSEEHSEEDDEDGHHVHDYYCTDGGCHVETEEVCAPGDDSAKCKIVRKTDGDGKGSSTSTSYSSSSGSINDGTDDWDSLSISPSDANLGSLASFSSLVPSIGGADVGNSFFQFGHP